MTTDDMDFEKSIKDTLANVDENTTVKAIVLDINEKEGVVFLDVNLKSEAQVPLTDFETKPSIGDAVDVYLIYRESHDGVPVVSLTKARQIKEKENLIDKINSNEPVDGEVVEVRKYGVLVKYGTLYGLIPFALWDKKRIDDISSIKEKKVSFYIEKPAQKKDSSNGKKGAAKEIKEDFIGNRKRVLFEVSKKSKLEFFDKTNVDYVLTGTVKNITDFGAFVEVAPGIEGLLHITNISWNKVTKVEDVLKKGDEVKVKVIHANVGAVTESDVTLAKVSNAIIIAFNVRPGPIAKDMAEKDGVEIKLYSVIYNAIEDVEAAMNGMLDPVFKEVIIGNVEVRQIFKISNVGTIAGCYVTTGKVVRNAGVRVLRDNVVIHEGKLISLKRMKDDSKEVAAGYECGIQLENYNDIQEGDIIEAFIMEQIK